MITREEVRSLYKIVQTLYLEDEIPWVIGYSGGKDSTATVQLVWQAIDELPVEKRNKKIHVISTDTLVESPVMAKWVKQSLEMIRIHSKAKNMPIIPHRLEPITNDTFWVNLLGRGYPYPRPTMRWCTDRLKIKPSNKFVQDVVSKYGEVILLLGTRKAESANRAKTMEYYEKKRVRDYLSPNGTLQNELVFSPLENWTDDDVWFFLMQYSNPWGYSNKELLSLYKGATADGECPLVMTADTPSCGKSRFGCWVCTMVEKDKSMAAMILNDSEKEWMMPLMDFRNEIGDAERDRERRDFRRMTGNVLLFKGRLVHGPYKKEIREIWLEKLLQIQLNININGPEEFKELELITIDELNKIRQIWLEEKHEFDDSLPQIYRKILGKEFPGEAEKKSKSFGKEEWELLKKVSREKYPEEELLFEMAARLIDTERSFTNKKKRKGIYNSLEKEINRCFYKNEEDAVNFAQEQLVRKKNMGASYDRKAELDEQIEVEEWGVSGGDNI